MLVLIKLCRRAVINNKIFTSILISAFRRMSSRKRYFINSYEDYSGQNIQINSNLWKQRCLEVIREVCSKQGTTDHDCDGGLYVGVAGVSYACYYISQLHSFADTKAELLSQAEKFFNYAMLYTQRKSKAKDKTDQVGFLLGASGIYATAALISEALGKTDQREMFLKRYAAVADICIPMNFLRCGSDELLVGRAGYICGLLLLNKRFCKEVLSKEKAFLLWQTMVQSGREYAKRHHSPCPLMYAYYNTEYLGAAHGLSGILQMLISFPEFLSAQPDAEQDIKRSVDFMLSLQTPTGNFPCAMDEVRPSRPEEDELVHWCHGAPGVVYLMAKAFKVWGEQKYLQSCLNCAEVVWTKGLLRKGPGICHGVAGSGYVFLVLYQITSDPKYLYRALVFADFMFGDEFKTARRPDSPYSLYEGLAGTCCYLADLQNPGSAEFPFFNLS